MYSQDENWYIPLRANISKKKPKGAYFETPFKTSNNHFKRPGLDFEKSIFVPIDYTIEIRNTLPPEQSEFIFSKQIEIRESFEEYVIGLDQVDKNSTNYKFSTVPLFPDGIEQIRKLTICKKNNEVEKLTKEEEGVKPLDQPFRQEALFENMIDVLPEEKKEIELSKRGESMYPETTNQKELNKETKNPELNPVNRAKELIESDEIKQWSKNPTIYFVTGLRKVALEFTPDGTFIESKKYPATTEEAKKKVAELLSSEAVLTKKTSGENRS